ncbi:MAG: CopG family transcriptional regulator, partial [Deltaproteobacteria bacterium]|nr:CopG family transcriptional regulator [Deltaproteobacteria bacterium]
MSRKKLAKSVKEFDRRFDEGEDIHDLIDMSKAKMIRHGKKVRITLDIAEELVRDIDRIRDSIGVDW